MHFSSPDIMAGIIAGLSRNMKERVEFDDTKCWIVIKNVRLSDDWNKESTDILFLYDTSINDVSVFLDSDLEYMRDDRCEHMFEFDLEHSGWKKLCTWAYNDKACIDDMNEVLTKVLCMMSLPSICRYHCKA
ncbi:hypothetical protein CUJ83_08135 [Methanocella sp. CWC-04]|uniref:Uncharacterized protein n=1 Tax=Methanooceanicella nereidis TaxID=2052831 RepID=A0AAP2REB5_9EURY|nr:hypothetical protein [Methanocella sp. CWC-04]MCD1294965.1 hypothetical protein [Methanocella sp. CWC-04]